MLCQVQEDPSGIQSCIQNIKKMVYWICLFLHDKKKKTVLLILHDGLTGPAEIALCL